MLHSNPNMVELKAAKSDDVKARLRFKKALTAIAEDIAVVLKEVPAINRQEVADKALTLAGRVQK